MKKLLKLSPFIVFSLLTISLIGCSNDDDKESCTKSKQNIGTCSADDITACCDAESKCYYVYNGKNYSLDEIADMCAPNASAQHLKSTQLQLDVITQQLINEARSAAICR